MIREKHLVPGRVLGRWSDHPDVYKLPRNPDLYDVHGDPIGFWNPCMVISYIPDVRRRHSKKTAPVYGWDVLVFWLDDRQHRVESVRIPTDHDGWKLLW